jgi:hypothetical protein
MVKPILPFILGLLLAITGNFVEIENIFSGKLPIVTNVKCCFCLFLKFSPQIIYAHILNAYLHRIPLRHDR